MAKVKCRVCEHEIQGFCSVKKSSVKLNKSRVCRAFKHDITKVKVKQRLDSEMRPDWFHDRKGYINKLKKAAKEETESKRKDLFDPSKYAVHGLDSAIPKAELTTGDDKHPLTGDLSRFVSSVGEHNTEDVKDD